MWNHYNGRVLAKETTIMWDNDIFIKYICINSTRSQT